MGTISQSFFVSLWTCLVPAAVGITQCYPPVVSIVSCHFLYIILHNKAPRENKNLITACPCHHSTFSSVRLNCLVYASLFSWLQISKHSISKLTVYLVSFSVCILPVLCISIFFYTTTECMMHCTLHHYNITSPDFSRTLSTNSSIWQTLRFLCIRHCFLFLRLTFSSCFPACCCISWKCVLALHIMPSVSVIYPPCISTQCSDEIVNSTVLLHGCKCYKSIFSTLSYFLFFSNQFFWMSTSTFSVMTACFPLPLRLSCVPSLSLPSLSSSCCFPEWALKFGSVVPPPPSEKLER